MNPSHPESSVAPQRIDAAAWQTCLDVLDQVWKDPTSAPDLEPLERRMAKLCKRARKDRRKESAVERNQHDRTLVAETGRVQGSSPRPVPSTDPASGNVDPVAGQAAEFRPLESRSRTCYICQVRYRQVHHFYHLLCPDCAETNFRHRLARADLTGRVALVTGGRIKIGYQTGLKLLRDGARVHVATRFARDAAIRYGAEPDLAEWRDRLTIHAVDFCNVPATVKWIDRCRREWPALDILVNNAAHSVRRSPEYYARLARIESDPAALPANLAPLLGVSSNKTDDPLPAGRATGLQTLASLQIAAAEVVDTREENSWTRRLADVEPLEWLEVLLVNANAPGLLAGGLAPLLERSAFPDRYVINVTGLDGQFGRAKSVRHPHVNMTKAALNMMTRTSAADYAARGIHMTSVDTGWITHEGAYSSIERMRAQGFVPPLDEVDGAARIYAPIRAGLSGDAVSGVLLRNYQPADW